MSKLPADKGFNANLENFELTDMIQLITQQMKSGELIVEGSEGSCSWSFKNGSLVAFNCNVTDNPINLRKTLEHFNIIDKTDLTSLTKDYDLTSSHTLEKRLVQNNIINEEELEKINLRSLIESFIITLQWTTGRYRFIPTDKINSHPFMAPQDANFVVLEALRQIDEMQIIKDKLQPLSQTYKATPAPSEQMHAKGDGASGKNNLKDLFDRGELEIYRLLNGERSLQEIIRISVTGQLHTCSTISDFLNRNIITPVTSDTGYHFKKASGFTQNQHLVALALLILSGALLISTLMAVKPYSTPSSRRNPTLFSAIIDNLRADQKQMQVQASKLLSPNHKTEE